MDDIELFISYYMLYLMYLMIRELNQSNSHANRRWWVKPIHLDRDMFGYFSATYLRIKNNDSEEFFKHTRMIRPLYDNLLNLLEEGLTKHSLRKPIDFECRLAITLSYLSQGVSHQFLSWSYHMGKSTVREIILETCKLIWQVLHPLYVPMPSNDTYKNIAEGFLNHWNMPNCVGAIDGKYVNVTCPPNTGSLFYDHKGNYSVVLLAACDYNYRFTYVDVGSYGSQSDGGVLSQTHAGQTLLNGTMSLPRECNLPNTTTKFPFFFVGDAAFPLKKNLMRPFPGKLLDDRRRIFNYRLSRARRTIENSFGILVARWRILLTTINALPENVEHIVLATIVLHNYIKHSDSSQNVYCPNNYVDWEDENGIVHRGEWRNEVENSLRTARMGSNNAARTAFTLRDTLADYFMTDGAVPFQWRRI